MAGCQALTRMVLVFFMCLPSVFCFKQRSYDVVFQDFSRNVFQRHLKVSRHNPLCVVFRNAGVGSRLEKTLYGLWQNKDTVANFTKWQVGAFNADQTEMPPKNVKPERLPAVRCYLGETSSYEYDGKVSTPGLNNWLTQLTDIYTQQSVEVTQAVLQRVQKRYHIVLLAFPDGPRHHEVEDMIYGLAAVIDSCKALAVHLNAKDVGILRKKYGVNKYPSVVVIHNHMKVINGSMTVKEEYRVFPGQHVNHHVLNIYILAYTLEAPLLDMQIFEDLLTPENVTAFSPVLICFYAHWGSDVVGFMTAYNMTLAQYREDDVNMRYGLVDLTQESSKKLVNRYLKSKDMQHVPFLAIFSKDTDGRVIHSVLPAERPYPWAMYKSIKKISEGLLHMAGVKECDKPWGTLPPHQMSTLQEGPLGFMCTVWSHNMTDSTPPPQKPVIKKQRKATPKIVKQQHKSWHDLFDTDKLETKLSRHDGIPLVTSDTWSDIVEKSHAPKHIFYKTGQWAGEVTKVSMVVFIMADCGSCRRNNQTFRDLQTAVSHIDGGAMYYVNCTAEPVLCRNHVIRGFPTITAFRGLGWLSNGSCVTDDSHKLFKKYVRVDYHGVIRPSPVMEWFSKVAGNAVTNMKFDRISDSFMDKDVRLIATLEPKTEKHFPSLSTTSLSPSFNYKCLRLLCERLYSIVDCYSQLVPSLEYNMKHVEFMVTQIDLERRDGIKALVMKMGENLYDTLEDESITDLHMFHQTHRYNLDSSKTCEDDPAVCTDIITEFVLDHSRLPVTPLTSDMFHTSTSLMKEETLPILIALVHPANITQSAHFLQELTVVAYTLYNRIIVMTLDVDKYSVWATNFVPALYGHRRVFESDEPDPLSMYIYPRLCIVQKHDHNHAALYPPITRQRQEQEDFSRETILDFVQSYLEDPQSVVVKTEHF